MTQQGFPVRVCYMGRRMGAKKPSYIFLKMSEVDEEKGQHFKKDAHYTGYAHSGAILQFSSAMNCSKIIGGFYELYSSEEGGNSFYTTSKYLDEQIDGEKFNLGDWVTWDMICGQEQTRKRTENKLSKELSGIPFEDLTLEELKKISYSLTKSEQINLTAKILQYLNPWN